jgi:hypothetical protein
MIEGDLLERARTEGSFDTPDHPEFRYVCSVKDAKADLENGPGSPEALLCLLDKRKSHEGLEPNDPDVRRHWEIERPQYDALMEQLETLESGGVEAFAVRHGQTLNDALDTAVTQGAERREIGTRYRASIVHGRALGVARQKMPSSSSPRSDWAR